MPVTHFLCVTNWRAIIDDPALTANSSQRERTTRLSTLAVATGERRLLPPRKYSALTRPVRVNDNRCARRESVPIAP